MKTTMKKNDNLKKVTVYKGVDIYYNLCDAKLYFDFGKREQIVKYLFEAQEIIDKPVWEECDLQGYFKDFTFIYIGLARAKRKNIKTGNPDWEIKGKDDYGFEQSERHVFLKSPENEKIYNEWEKEYEKLKAQESKIKDIISKLKDDEERD